MTTAALDTETQAELTLFGDSVKRYLNSCVLPEYDAWEAAEIFPRQLWKDLGEQGFLAVDIPEAYGGMGVDFRFSMEVAEQIMRANLGALGSSIIVHSDICAHYLLNNGTEAQKQRYLPGMVSGDIIGAIAMTEPGAGSDLQGIRTNACRDGDDWILNGSKTFITNGQHADLIIVAARSNPDVSGARGTSLFLVDADMPGFTRGRNLEKIGLHAGDTSELFFENVRLPGSAVLGEVDRGFAVLMGELMRERLALAVGAVAAAEGMLAETIDYVKERKAFGVPVATFQNTKFKLAEMATDVRLNRSFVNECTQRFAAGELDVSSVSMAKLAATEMQNRVADGCLQLYGGYGYMREYGVSRGFVDARIQRIYGGTSEIMKELISRDLLK